MNDDDILNDLKKMILESKEEGKQMFEFEINALVFQRVQGWSNITEIPNSIILHCASTFLCFFNFHLVRVNVSWTSAVEDFKQEFQ